MALDLYDNFSLDSLSIKEKEGKAHPFIYKELFVQMLAPYLNYDELKTTRLVCRDWYSYFTTPFFGKTVVIYESKEDEKKKCFPPHYINYVDALNIKTFDDAFFGPNNVSATIMANLTHLTLGATKSVSYTSVKDGLFQILINWAPNLKFFKVDNLLWKNEPFFPPDKEFAYKDVIRMVNLNHLEIVSTRPPQCYVQKFLVMILELVKSVHTLKLDYDSEKGVGNWVFALGRGHGYKVMDNVKEIIACNKSMAFPVPLEDAANQMSPSRLRRLELDSCSEIGHNGYSSGNAIGLHYYLVGLRYLEELVLHGVFLHGINWPCASKYDLGLSQVTKLKISIKEWGKAGLYFVFSFPKLKELDIEDLWGHPIPEKIMEYPRGEKDYYYYKQTLVNKLRLMVPCVDITKLHLFFPYCLDLECDLTKGDWSRQFDWLVNVSGVVKLKIKLDTNAGQFFQVIVNSLPKTGSLKVLEVKNQTPIMIDHEGIFSFGFFQCWTLNLAILENIDFSDKVIKFAQRPIETRKSLRVSVINKGFRNNIL